jgi:hypothetical protein
MAYVADNLGLSFCSTGGGALPRMWVYKNATPDSDGTITGSGYFSDGVTKGMKVGDIVDAIDTGTPKYKRYQVASVSGAAATVAAPTAIT